MPHISGKKLNEKVLKKLFRQFSNLNANLESYDSNKFLSSLLTETEQVMLAKRLAAVVMLHEGYSQYAVENTLNISSSTVARVGLALETGMYDSVILLFNKKKEEKEKFWSTLEILLRAGMPSMGKDRWKHLP